jgi:hypothetical protein
MKKLLFLVIFCSFLFGCGIKQLNYKNEVIKPLEVSAGYEYVYCDEVIVLKPKEWQFVIEQAKGNKAFFISKEHWKKNEFYRTGLAGYILRNVSNLFKMPANLSSVRYLEIIKSNRNIDVLDTWSSDKNEDGYEVFGMEVRNREIPHAPIRIYYVCFANNELDVMYNFVFESPEEDWEENKKIGSKILSKVNFLHKR